MGNCGPREIFHFNTRKGAKMMIHGRRLPLLLFFGCAIFATGLITTLSQAASEIQLSKGQTVYVPIYSQIYIGDRQRPFLLAATLSIRNTDPDHQITILSVEYYASDGKQLKQYLKKPEQLNPMASTRYFVKESDKSGGSGANFLVKWKSEQEVNEPIIEGVMISTESQQGISFLSRGRSIKSK